MPPATIPQSRRHDIDRETEQVDQKQIASAQIVYRAVLKEGQDELSRSTPALAWSGLAAGLSMGFSLVTEGLLRSHLPESNWRPLIVKFGYSVGFLIVVLGRQQLFTENTLTPVLPLLHHRRRGILVNTLRLWAVVLGTNLIGAVLFANVIARTPAFEETPGRPSWPSVRRLWHTVPVFCSCEASLPAG